mmetsp:Transcript_1487/g.5103  ORF Transcript_1487/g.5103 Transcript_1487/m.5103 type:complete len:295 (-) Transcript_1487:365-1249(-)
MDGWMDGAIEARRTDSESVVAEFVFDFLGAFLVGFGVLVRVLLFFVAGLLLGGVGWVDHGLEGFVVYVEAEGDAAVEGLLGVVGGVDVGDVLGAHPSVVVVEGGVDDAVFDGLCDDELGGPRGLELELGGDVVEGDARVGDVDLAEAGLDDVGGEAEGEGVGRILLEAVGVGGEDVVEAGEGAPADGDGELQIGLQDLREAAGSLEGRPEGQFPHEELDEDGELVDRPPEAEAGVRRRLAHRLHQLRVRVRVVQLHRRDAPRVVEVAAELVVRYGLRKGRLRHELERRVDAVRF